MSDKILESNFQVKTFSVERNTAILAVAGDNSDKSNNQAEREFFSL